MARTSLGRAVPVLIGILLTAALASGQGVPRLDSYQGVAVRILQSNNAGTTHHIIDPTINQVVGVIKGCPHAHNLTTHPDGLYYYCANEQDRTVDVFDTKTLQLVQQIALSGRPNKIVVNKKQRKIYAAISVRSAKVIGPGFQMPADGSLPAVVDVIDIATHKVVRSVPVHLPVHNTYVTPDDKFVVAGLRGEIEPGEPTIQVIDAVTDKVVWGMELNGYKQYRQDHPRGSADGLRGQRRRIGEAHVRAGDRHQRGLGDRLEQAPDRGPAVAAEAAALEAERGRHSDRRHARPRGAARSFGRVGVESARQPHLRMEPARPEVHRRRRSGPERQLDDPDAGQQVHVCRHLRRGPHRGGGPEEARHRRQDQDGRAPGADQHGDPPPGSGQPDDDERPGEAVTAMAMGMFAFGRRRARTIGALGIFVIFAVSLAAAASARARGDEAQASAFPSAADIETFRSTVEKVFLTDRGGTIPGYAACVQCHTWQTSVRFSLETPATDAGWTAEQSRKNFDVVTKLVNTASPETSRLLLKPLAPEAGGLGHTGGTYWTSPSAPEYQALLKWIQALPADKYVAAKEPTLDFEFFRACVQPVFANPREGHIRCSNCHASGLIGFAPPTPVNQEWSDRQATLAFEVISRLVVPGNPEQSRFLLKPLHPDGGGSYTHNGPRRWQSRSDPEWQMLAAWVRGEKTGKNCS